MVGGSNRSLLLLDLVGPPKKCAFSRTENRPGTKSSCDTSLVSEVKLCSATLSGVEHSRVGLTSVS